MYLGTPLGIKRGAPGTDRPEGLPPSAWGSRADGAVPILWDRVRLAEMGLVSFAMKTFTRARSILPLRQGGAHDAFPEGAVS